MDWRALTVFALIFGVAIGFAVGWYMGSNQSMDAAYQRGIEAGRDKVQEAKYEAQTSATNAKVAEINRQIELERQKNEALARRELSADAVPATRRYSSTPVAPPAQAPQQVAAAASDGPTWTELEIERAREVRAAQDARRQAEERAAAEQEARENEYVYLAAGVYHRLGCPFLTEPLVRAKLKDARLAAVPCSYCKPPL